MTTAQAVENLLNESIGKILALGVGPHPEEAEAFTSFRRAVTQASSGRAGTPADLLDNLEPKDVVLRFLFDFHERRRLYRKQIAALMSILMETAWISALKNDQALRSAIPAELDDIDMQSDEALPPPTPLPGGDGYPEVLEKPLAVQSGAVVTEEQAEERRVVPSEVTAALDMLQKAKAMIEGLNYSAVKTDDAIDAFELFRRAVVRVANLSSPEGRNTLESMDCKDKILEFLVDFHAREKKFRGRVNTVLLKLQGLENWEAAVQQDPSVRDAVKELTEDASLPEKKVFRAGLAVNLAAAAIGVGKRGGLGSLYVRVFSAKLPQHGRCPNPYVRVSFNDRSKRTAYAMHSFEPCWDSEPFLFDVMSTGDMVLLEVLDTEFMNDRLLGSVSLLAVGAPRKPGFATHSLVGMQSGEMKLEMVFMPAKEDAAERESRQRSSAAQENLVNGLTSAIHQLDGQPERAPWSMANGYIPAGDDILVETMTVEEAKLKCAKLPECKGFTHQGLPTSEAVQIFFKSSATVDNDGTQWTSYLRAEASGEQIYRVGADVKYYSEHKQAWFDAELTAVNRDGVEIDLKPGYKFKGNELEKLQLLRAEDNWLVFEPGKASVGRSFASKLGSGALQCPAGHAIEKKKEGLHWFEGWVGYKHGQDCDLCGHTFKTREESRYRCTQHCPYDICETCYYGCPPC